MSKNKPLPPLVLWSYLGEVPYAEALAWQHSLARRLENDPTIPGYLMLLTHPPTFTVGRRDSSLFLSKSPEELKTLGFDFAVTDRGGLVTYHGPGQLVGYPILRLKNLGLSSVPDYVKALEDAMLALCRDYDQEGRRIEGLRGLFVGEDKIGAVGIHVHDDVTTHGFAFNVAPDLSHYGHIVACGLADHGITSLKKLGVETDVLEAAGLIAACLAETLGAELLEVTLPR